MDRISPNTPIFLLLNWRYVMETIFIHYIIKNTKQSKGNFISILSILLHPSTSFYKPLTNPNALPQYPCLPCGFSNTRHYGISVYFYILKEKLQQVNFNSCNAFLNRMITCMYTENRIHLGCVMMQPKSVVMPRLLFCSSLICPKIKIKILIMQVPFLTPKQSSI